MTIQRRIENLPDNIKEQLQTAAAKFNYFYLETDKFTDISSTPWLLLFVKRISENFEVSEEFDGISSIKERTTGADILSSIFNLYSAHNLDLNNFVSIFLLRNHLVYCRNDLLGSIALFTRHICVQNK